MEGPPVTGSWHRQDRTGGPWVEGARGPKGRRRGRGRRPECPLAARFPRLPCASQLRKRHRAPPRRLRRSSKLDSFVIPSPPPLGAAFLHRSDRPAAAALRRPVHRPRRIWSASWSGITASRSTAETSVSRAGPGATPKCTVPISKRRYGNYGGIDPLGPFAPAPPWRRRRRLA